MSKTFQQIHFTGEGFRTLRTYRLFFREELRRQLKIRADYDAEVTDWYENGDGRAPRYVVDTVCIACQATFEEDDTSSLGHCEETEDGQHHLSIRRYNAGGQGHTFPHCIHGSSRWTDYDNICGGCEDGSTAIEDAIIYAREHFLRFNQRWEWVMSAPGDLDFDTRKTLNEWAASLFPGFKVKTVEGFEPLTSQEG